MQTHSIISSKLHLYRLFTIWSYFAVFLFAIMVATDLSSFLRQKRLLIIGATSPKCTDVNKTADIDQLITYLITCLTSIFMAHIWKVKWKKQAVCGYVETMNFINYITKAFNNTTVTPLLFGKPNLNTS